jgi:hypothetical protein
VAITPSRDVPRPLWWSDLDVYSRHLWSATSDSAPSEARKRGSGGGSPGSTITYLLIWVCSRRRLNGRFCIIHKTRAKRAIPGSRAGCPQKQIAIQRPFCSLGIRGRHCSAVWRLRWECGCVRSANSGFRAESTKVEAAEWGSDGNALYASSAEHGRIL